MFFSGFECDNKKVKKCFWEGSFAVNLLLFGFLFFLCFHTWFMIHLPAGSVFQYSEMVILVENQ